MVLHNSFIFSLVFIMCFSVFHLHILIIFVLCFAGIAEASFVCCSVEISRFAKFCNLRNFARLRNFVRLQNFFCVHCSSSSLVVFYNLSFPAQYIDFSRFLSPSFNTYL